jgi:hypothetical protein
LHANQRAEQHEQIRDIPPGNKALMGQNGRVHCMDFDVLSRGRIDSAV